MLVVLSEATLNQQQTTNERELNLITETARMLGLRVYALPPEPEQWADFEAVLAYVPVFEQPQTGIWVGYIPKPEHYAALYHAAATRNIWLINTPEQYQTAMEFDRFYPLLGELTPLSCVITELGQLAAAEDRLGWPIFVKGAIKSNKEQGWQACVATTSAELEHLSVQLLNQPAQARGRVILRRFVQLRTLESHYQAFPLGREYRVFVYQNQVLAYGFYWDAPSEEFALNVAELASVKNLAREAARRVGTPFIAVDIGQLINGEWIVIEVGDGQFSGLSQVQALELWSQLKAKLEVVAE
ncbi:ATP-grasp domain-containing protein [Herpetosiphon sp. NSE202]|uniref:ATP-grasp domain-containing protein n=1 Tax=Herpetosiphon sp. NSE202 TaxID=3351349 RepID=UPI003629862C